MANNNRYEPKTVNPKKSETRVSEYSPIREYINKEKKLVQKDLGLIQNKQKSVSGNMNNRENRLVMEKATPGDFFLTYDLEALGTPAQFQKTSPTDIFNINELAFQHSNLDMNGKLVNSTEASSVMIKTRSSVREKMKMHVENLKHDPTYIRRLDPDTIRSLEDLALYDNNAVFGTMNFFGNEMPTVLNQSKRGTAQGIGITSSQNIRRIEEGLNNLYTKGAPINQAVEVLEQFGLDAHSKGKNLFFAGQNNQAYDKYGLLQAIDGLPNKEKTSYAKKLVSQPQLDTLPQVVTQKGSRRTTIGRNNKLSSLVKEFGTNSMDSNMAFHLGYFDVMQTTDVVNNLDFPFFQKTNNALEMIQSKNSFLATKGANEYSLPKGILSDISVYKNGELVPSRKGFIEAPFTKGREYELAGQFTDMILNDNPTPYSGVIFKDLATERIITFAGQDVNSIQSIFDNFLSPAGLKENELKIKEAKNDRARRRYERVISGDNSFGNSPIENYDKFYSDLEKIEKTKIIMNNPNASHKEIAKETVRRFGGTEVPYDSSVHKFEELSMVYERAMEEKPFYDRVRENALAQSLDTTNRNNDIENSKRQKSVFQSFFDSKEEVAPYKQKTMEKEGFAKWNKGGKERIIDLNDRDNLKKQLSITANKKGSKATRKKELTTMVESLGLHIGMEESEINKYLRLINEDLKSKEGNISQNLIDEITDSMYELRKNTSEVINTPGVSRNDGRTKASKMYKSLSEKTDSKVFMEINQRAQERIISDRNHSVSNAFNTRGLVQKLGLAKDSLSKSDKAYQRLIDITGISDRVMNKDFNQMVQELTDSFNKQKFSHSFLQTEDGISLFFDVSGKDITSMTPKQLRNSSNLGRLDLPLMTDNFLVNIQGDYLVNGFSMDSSGKISTTQQRYFEEMKKLPQDIQRELERNEKLNLKRTNEDIINSKIGYRKSNISGAQEVLAYAGANSENHKNSNAYKNMMSGTQLDLSGIANDWLKETHPEEYEKYTQKNNSKLPFFMNPDYNPSMKLKNDYIRNKESYAREKFGINTSGRLNQMGGNANFFGSGRIKLNPQLMTPGGEGDVAFTEVLEKSMNFVTQDRKRMEQILKEQGYSDSQIRNRLGITKTRLADELFPEIQSGINMSVADMSDIEVHKKLNIQVSKNSKEIAVKTQQLKAELDKAPEARNEYQIKKLESEISGLKNINQKIEEDLPKFSSYDGMTTIRKSTVSTLEKTEQRTLRLKEEEVVSKDLMKALQSSEEFNKLFPNGEFDGTQSFRLENPISSNDIKLDKQKQLTIGEYSKYNVIKEGEEVTKEIRKGTKTKIHENNWEIIGMDYDGNTKERSLIYRTRNTTDDGAFKVIFQNHSRNTVNTVHDETMDVLGKGIDAIAPNTGAKKANTTQYTVGTINQTWKDTVERMEQVSKNESLLNESPSIQKFLSQNPEFTAKDLSKLEVQNKYMDTIYQEQLKKIGLNDRIYSDGKGGMISDTDYFTNNPALQGELGVKNLFEEFRGDIYKGLGTKDQGLMGYEVKVHDINNWQGNLTDVTTNRKYLETIKGKFGEESLVYKTMINLNESSMKEEGLKIQKQIQNHLGLNSGTDVSTDILLDFMKTVGVDEMNNTVLNSDGSMTVGLSDVRSVGSDKSRLSIKGSTLDIDELEIRRNGTKITMKDMVKENGDVRLFGQLPENSGFISDRFPILSSEIRDGFDSNHVIMNEMKKTESDIIKDIELFNNITLNPNMTFEEKTKEINRITDRVNQNIITNEENYVKFSTSDKGFSATQHNEIIQEGHWKAVTTGNIMSQYEPKIIKDINGNRSISWQNTGRFEEGSKYISRNSMSDFITKDTIQGISEHLDVNKNYTASDYSKDSLFKEAKEVILDKLEQDKDAFIYTVDTRYPVNKRDTTDLVKARIDNSVKDNEALYSVGTMKRVLADTDGDNMTSNSLHYRNKGEALKEELVRLDKMHNKGRIELEKIGSEIVKEEFEEQFRRDSSILRKGLQGEGYSSEKIEETINNIIMDSFENNSDIFESVDPANHITQKFNLEEIANNFQNRNTYAQEQQSILSSLRRNTIGLADNVSNEYRQKAGVLKDISIQSNKPELFSTESYNIVEDFMAKISQDNISSKKISLENRFPNLATHEIESKVTEMVDAIPELIQSFRNVRIEDGNVVGIEDVYRNLQKSGIYETGKASDPKVIEEIEELKRFLPELAKINENTEPLGYHKEYSGQGSKYLAKLNGENLKDVEKIPLNKIQIEIDASDKIRREQLETSKRNRVSSIIQNLESNSGINESSVSIMGRDKINRVLHQKELSETIETGIDIFTTQKQRAVNDMYNIGENNIKRTKKVFKNAMDSSLMQGAMAFAGVWAASALFRKAPTPEGNEAQQEATPQQVNPSALLTSPTARITQDNEMINLSINATGNGNIDHNEIAALVQNQINSMTGNEMAMNINVSDNTSNLTNKWYQDKISSIFGLN